MGGISAYILSVVGIVFVGVLVDIIMPEGAINSYIKGMFSIISLFVMVSPIQKLIDGDFDMNNFFYNETSVQIDKDFIEATNKDIVVQLENATISKLTDAGFANVDVEIVFNLSGYQIDIEKVNVDISKMVINQNMPHINKYTEIKDVVCRCLNLEEGDVVINE